MNLASVCGVNRRYTSFYQCEQKRLELSIAPWSQIKHHRTPRTFNKLLMALKLEWKELTTRHIVLNLTLILLLNLSLHSYNFSRRPT